MLVFWLTCIPVRAADSTGYDPPENPATVVLEQLEPQIDVNAPTLSKPRLKQKSIKLTGGVEHSQELAPVSRKLRAGNTFLESELPKIDSPDVWYRIPRWFSGVWEKRQEQVLSIQPLSRAEKLMRAFASMPANYSFKALTRIRNGHQLDAKSNIWSYLSYPYQTRVEGSETYTLQHIYLQEPVELRQDRVSLKFVGTSYEISRYNNEIIAVKQIESITTYRPMKPGLIKARVSMKVFNARGKPKSLEIHEFIQYSVKPFSPMDFSRGKDLRHSFRHYLQAHKLDDLVLMQERGILRTNTPLP